MKNKKKLSIIIMGIFLTISSLLLYNVLAQQDKASQEPIATQVKESFRYQNTIGSQLFYKYVLEQKSGFPDRIIIPYFYPKAQKDLIQKNLVKVSTPSEDYKIEKYHFSKPKITSKEYKGNVLIMEATIFGETEINVIKLEFSDGSTLDVPFGKYRIKAGEEEPLNLEGYPFTWATPAVIIFDYKTPKEKDEFLFRVKNEGQKALTINKFIIDEELFDVNFKEVTIKANEEREIIFPIKPKNYKSENYLIRALIWISIDGDVSGLTNLFGGAFYCYENYTDELIEKLLEF